MEPAVTVIVPVYNTVEYLDDVKASLDAQSLADFRVLAVDDGSTDGSGEQLDAYAEQDPRWRVVHQANGGLSAARNRALDELAKEDEPTQYLLFLDSDDMLRSDALERLVAAAGERDTDVLFFSGTGQYETDDLRERFPQYQTLYRRDFLDESVQTGSEFMATCRHGGNLTVQCCMELLRTDFVRERALRFLDGITHEDNLFTGTVLLKAERASFLPEEFYLRRVREDSIMTRPKSWKNVDGYFRCVLGMLGQAEDPELRLDADEQWALEDFIGSLVWLVRDTYHRTAGEERERGLDAYSVAERALFAALVRDPVVAQEQAEERVRTAAEEGEQRVRAAAQEAEGRVREEFANSPSFKIGRAVTWLPRTLKGGRNG